MGVSRWFRYMPFAFMRRDEPTVAELRKKLGTGSAKPKRTYGAKWSKLRIPRMSVVRRKQA